VIDAQESTPHRIFLLSPAALGGKRAEILAQGRFPLAMALSSAQGATIGEVFTFLSGLYFRGKLAYARAFARRSGEESADLEGVQVITAGGGLMSPDERITGRRLRAFGRIDIDAANPRFCQPLIRDAELLRARCGASDVILLGSIATGKYLDVLLEIFGDRLLFPSAFVGRGDLSRGGLLLRCARTGTELD
jgi:hypothetical protein